ncbi:TPA: restriction endonuclease subunit S [Bacillus cereus]
MPRADLPNWTYVTLGECLRSKPSYGANTSAIPYDESLPRYLRITDIDDNGDLSEEDKKSISLKDAEGNMLESGDIVFARSGATVGKTYLHKGNEDMAYAGYLIRFQVDATVLLPEYLFLFTHSIPYWEWVHKNLRAGAQPNINSQEYCSLEIPLPSIPEQQKIVDVVNNWDNAVRVAAKKLEKYELFYKAIGLHVFEDLHSSDNLFPARESFNTVSVRNRIDLPLLAVTQDLGVVRRDELDRRVMMPEGNISNYKVVQPGNFIISLRSFEGGIEYSDITGLVSPAYTVLESKVELHSDFYRHYFKSRSFIGRLDQMIYGIRDGKQISFRDFGDMKIPFIQIKDQVKIASLFNNVEKIVNLSKKELRNVKEQKRSVMQKIFAGDVRVELNG